MLGMDHLITTPARLTENHVCTDSLLSGLYLDPNDNWHKNRAIAYLQCLRYESIIYDQLSWFTQIEIEEFKRPIIAELEELRQEKNDLERVWT